jgi:hypothetical protein
MSRHGDCQSPSGRLSRVDRLTVPRGALARSLAAVRYGMPTTTKPNSRKRKPRRPQVKEWHVFEITDWDWDFTFGLYKSKFHPGPFLDSRHLKLRGSMLSPKKLAAKVIAPKLNLSPQDNLTETGRLRITEPKHVGVVYTRGKSYQANLYFPADVLGPILQMLIADRYRYLKIEVGELREGGYSEVTTFYFSGKLEDDDPTT